MRVLIIHHREFNPTVIRAIILGQYLSRLGHIVTIISTSKRNKFKYKITKEDNITYFESPDLLTGRLRMGVDLYNTIIRIIFLWNKNFDIIHAFDSRPNVIIPTLILKRRKRIPLVMDWADWWGKGGTIDQRSGRLYKLTFGYIETFFEEHFRKYANGATTICSSLSDRLRSLGFIGKILILPHGCNAEEFVPRPKTLAQKSLNLDSKNFYVGYLGNIFYNDAILLFNTIELANLNKPVSLIMIGRNFNKIPQTYSSNVIYTGEVSNSKLIDFLSSCDLCILPLHKSIANNGRWPSKINDYLQMGKPIVSTSISDMNEVFSKWNIGIISNDDPKSLASAINSILDNKELRESMINNALTLAKSEFSWKYLANKLSNFYSSLN